VKGPYRQDWISLRSPRGPWIRWRRSYSLAMMQRRNDNAEECARSHLEFLPSERACHAYDSNLAMWSLFQARVIRTSGSNFAQINLVHRQTLVFVSPTMIRACGPFRTKGQREKPRAIRDTDDEKEAIKEGRIPDAWKFALSRQRPETSDTALYDTRSATFSCPLK